MPAEELTVSLVREAYPRKVIAELRKRGAVIEERFPGIYYVTGNTLFATQIIVIRQLSREGHSIFRVLSKHAQEEDVRRFLAEYEKAESPGDRHNMDAVLQISILANRYMYQKWKGDMQMCEALRELMKEEFQEEVDKKVSEAVAKVEAKAEAEVAKAEAKAAKAEAKAAKAEVKAAKTGKQEALIVSIRNLMSSMLLTAEQAMNALGIPVEERSFYIAKLDK